jgi:hypothetical protein
MTQGGCCTRAGNNFFAFGFVGVFHLVSCHRRGVSTRPPASRQHAARNPKSPVLYSGQCAWGHRFADDGVTLEVDEYEQNVTAVVRHMRASGYKLRQIVEALKELGVVGRTGKPIGTTRVFEIIHGARKKPGRSTPPESLVVGATVEPEAVAEIKEAQ